MAFAGNYRVFPLLLHFALLVFAGACVSARPRPFLEFRGTLPMLVCMTKLYNLFECVPRTIRYQPLLETAPVDYWSPMF